eukprot:2615061-Rhodomonas_salina.2
MIQHSFPLSRSIRSYALGSYAPTQSAHMLLRSQCICSYAVSAYAPTQSVRMVLRAPHVHLEVVVLEHLQGLVLGHFDALERVLPLNNLPQASQVSDNTPKSNTRNSTCGTNCSEIAVSRV